jgi:hypothetical protein
MRKLNFHPSLLQIIYLIIYVALFAVIIYVPTLITGPLRVTGKLIIQEELIEGSLLAVLFVINILMLNLYKKEAKKQKKLIQKVKDEKAATKEKLDESSKYIGQLNVQIQEVKAIFNTSNRFPLTKSDLKKAFTFFSDRVFGIVNTNWVLFRIINYSTQKTISEQFETRQGFTSNYPHIGNKKIVEQQSCPSFTTIISNPPNVDILSCCILPVGQISTEERVFIQAIINELTMMFVLFNYTCQDKAARGYYQNSLQ